MTKVPMYLAISIFMTMLPALVTALPFSTRDYFTSKFDPKVVQFLLKYGHLQPKPDTRELRLSHEHRTTQPTSHSNNEISNGIKSLQNSFGLKRSGNLDEDTVKVINTPRCGMSDKEIRNPFDMKIIHNRVRRYVIGKLKWKKKKLTWKIVTYYPFKLLSEKAQDDAVAKAFQQWEYTSDFLFVKTSSNNADIRILFARGSHGDGQPFDGPGQVLAHAFPPYKYTSLAGDIHFDASESWHKGNVDLYSVALHEIGHSLGIGHSMVKDSVMFATYAHHTFLHKDDRLAMDKLYGPCKAKIDAASYEWGDVYFYRKDKVWLVDEYTRVNNFAKGYPKKIKDEFVPEVPNDVQAALVWSDYYLYFLKGDRSYGYHRRDHFVRYDRKISYDWVGIPNNPDAGLCYTDDEITWFFKGDLCWKVDDWDITVFAGYPKKISKEWPGLPNDIDAAYYSVWDRKTYFFKDNKYWVVDFRKDSKGKMNKKAYPGGLISQKWLGVCSEKY